jgi:hypothetical protein
MAATASTQPSRAPRAFNAPSTIRRYDVYRRAPQLPPRTQRRLDAALRAAHRRGCCQGDGRLRLLTATARGHSPFTSRSEPPWAHHRHIPNPTQALLPAARTATVHGLPQQVRMDTKAGLHPIAGPAKSALLVRCDSFRRATSARRTPRGYLRVEALPFRARAGRRDSWA